MRIVEIISDFRNIQTYIASIRASPSADESNEEGFQVLRRCVVEAQTLLAQPFQTTPVRRGSWDEEEVAQMRRIITDAAVRRFRAQKIYLKATAALRWVNSRQAILQGQKPGARHMAALLQIQNNLRAELLSVTDQRVELSLRSPDIQAGKWVQEDPSLATVQRILGTTNGRQ